MHAVPQSCHGCLNVANHGVFHALEVKSGLPSSNKFPSFSCRILATSVGELQKKYQKETLVFSKVSQHNAMNFLEYCCFKALATATQNTNFLKDKQLRHLSFDMMLAWESPNSVVMCFKVA